MEERTIIAEGSCGRLDRLIADRWPDLSRARAQALIREGLVLVNGTPCKPSYSPEPGDEIRVQMPAVAQATPEAETIPISVVYEDAYLLVIDKPAGLVTHPGAGHLAGTLVNALLAHRPDLAAADLAPERPGIVHRLDRDTSGLMVVAADREVQRALQAAFKARQVDKTYLALLHGRLGPERGAIDSPIGRHPAHRQRMTVLAEGGRAARTEYRVREYIGDYTLVEADLLTGRTHQLRVHLSAIGHPVVGDRVYGRRRDRAGARRQFLHAWRLAFQHPVTGERLAFESPLPKDLQAVLEALRRAA